MTKEEKVKQLKEIVKNRTCPKKITHDCVSCVMHVMKYWCQNMGEVANEAKRMLDKIDKPWSFKEEVKSKVKSKTKMAEIPVRTLEDIVAILGTIYPAYLSNRGMDGVKARFGATYERLSKILDKAKGE